MTKHMNLGWECVCSRQFRAVRYDLWCELGVSVCVCLCVCVCVCVGEKTRGSGLDRGVGVGRYTHTHGGVMAMGRACLAVK